MKRKVEGKGSSAREGVVESAVKAARRRSKREGKVEEAMEGAFHLKQAKKNLSRAKQKTQMKQRKNEVFPSLHTYTNTYIHRQSNT